MQTIQIRRKTPDELMKETNKYIGGLELSHENKMQLLAMVTALGFAGKKAQEVRFGRWRRKATIDGLPVFACGRCGNGEHLYGANYPRKLQQCPACGRINAYPWEEVYEAGSSLWEVDEP